MWVLDTYVQITQTTWIRYFYTVPHSELGLDFRVNQSTEKVHITNSWQKSLESTLGTHIIDSVRT